MFIPLIGDLGAPELLIILAVLVLLFGASKLPELARGSGRALRIFKAETKGLMDDDDKSSEERGIEQGGRASTEPRDDAGATDPQGERRNNTAD
jgi:sec-independent protein translocase protein TatA